MKNFGFLSHFANNSAAKTPKKRQFNRICRFEQLEERELLSVSVAEFETIKNLYGDLNLTDYADYNIIEVTANKLSETTLQDAIWQAGRVTDDELFDAKDDLIVVRTTATQNTVSPKNGISVYADSEKTGTTIIVGFGTHALTLDGSQIVYYKNRNDNSTLRIWSDTKLANITVRGANFAPEHNPIKTYIPGIGGGWYEWTVFIPHKAAGIYLAEGNLTMTGCTVSDNHIDVKFAPQYDNSYTVYVQGAGIFHGSTGDLFISNSVIANNSVSAICTGNTSIMEVMGGGIYCGSSFEEVGDLILNNVQIIGNSVTAASVSKIESVAGGGLYVQKTATLTNCLIAGNDISVLYGIAAQGAGIYAGEKLTLTNCIIAGNGRSDMGTEGVYAQTLTATNCTIVGNRDYGINCPSATLNNTVVARNGTDIKNGTKVSGGNNFIGAWSGTFSSGSNNMIGSSANPLDPKFVSFSYPYVFNKKNWQSWNLMPRADSPLVDAGRNALYDGAFDIAGNPRIANNTIDIGAYEYGPDHKAAALPVVPLSKHITKTKGSGYKSPVKGMKLRKNDVDTTIASLALSWKPNKKKDKDTSRIVIDVYGPKPKVKGATAPLIATISLHVNFPSLSESEGAAVYILGDRTKGFLIVICDLEPGTKYTFKMQATNSVKFSKMTTFSASTKKYAMPAGIKKTSTNDSITLSWKKSPVAETTHYEIRDAVSGELLETVLAPETAGRVLWTFDDLIPSTTYKFEIRAVSDVFDGITSKVAKVSVKTKK